MKFVAYIRVSGKQQGDSGLGIEAQRTSILREVGQVNVVGEFVEVRTGRDDERPELARAMKTCRELGATLIVARLDRLTRRVRFACELLESGVQMAVVGMPNMSVLVFQILCVVAEEESRLISVRTKAALAEAKKRGSKLGGFRGLGNKRKAVARTDEDRQLGIQIKQLRAMGYTFATIAEVLNEQGRLSPTGKPWSKSKVRGFISTAEFA